MFCPRCGTPNEDGASYCSSCGARLPEDRPESGEERERRSLRQRAGRLVGGTRRERVISVVTVLAIGIAIVAVVVLATGEDQDEYTQQANAICVESKQALATVANRVAGTEGKPAAAISLVGNATAEIVGDWRRQFAALDPPPDRQEAAAQLDQALAGVERAAEQAGALPAPADAERFAAQLAAALARTEQAVDGLGLEECAEVSPRIGRLEAR